MKVNYFNSYEEMSGFAAKFVAERVNAKPGFVLGLPTGSTPLGMYSALAEMNKKGEVCFKSVTTFNLDEYLPIKRSHEQSYYRFMHDNFFDHINIDKEKVNILNGETADSDAECSGYEKKIEAAGGIDLMILGIGENGHIGFNEPGNDLSSVTFKVELTENTRENNKRFFDSIDEVPKYALSMGMGTILKCREILMLVKGNNKKEAFLGMTQLKVTTANPSSFLNLHNAVTVLTDLKI